MLRRFLLQVIVDAMIIYLIAYSAPSLMTVKGTWSPLYIALIISLLDFFIKPIMKILSLPINILTFGLFNLIINALILEAASALAGSPIFHISSFMGAVVCGIIMSTINSLIYILFRRKD